MPHIRPRLVLAPLLKYLKFWPVVGLVGARQTGKSVLLQELLLPKQSPTADEQLPLVLGGKGDTAAGPLLMVNVQLTLLPGSTSAGKENEQLSAEDPPVH